MPCKVINSGGSSVLVRHLHAARGTTLRPARLPFDGGRESLVDDANGANRGRKYGGVAASVALGGSDLGIMSRGSAL
jgi:hypothetical protein